jgi:hypothetical protein
MPPALFALVILEIGSHYLHPHRIAWTIILFYASYHSWWQAHATAPSFFVLTRDLMNFLPSWPQTIILLISASQVATITSMALSPQFYPYSHSLVINTCMQLWQRWSKKAEPLWNTAWWALKNFKIELSYDPKFHIRVYNPLKSESSD